MPDTINHEIHNCVQSLFDTLIDISKGYDLLVERADEEVRAVVQELASQHAEDINEIEKTAHAQGIELDRSGTAMSQVHKAAVKLRDLFTDIDHDALKAVADGEENVIKRYDAVIKELNAENALCVVLTRQREQLHRKINQISETV